MENMIIEGIEQSLLSKFVSTEPDVLQKYEHFFFEKICSMRNVRKDDLSVPLSMFDEYKPLTNIWFSTVQDSIARMDARYGRLSTFQWRHCLFIPIASTTNANDIYKETFDLIKSHVPSLFIRSYVYAIFIRVDTNTLFPISSAQITPTTRDFKIYLWNTQYKISEATQRKELFGDTTNINNVGEQVDKLFIVSHPDEELMRVRDANSDVIDAVRAFYGELPIVDQTQTYLDRITAALDNNEEIKIIAEGPARSGKTILAMSLLSKYKKSRMLLMNWYFYSALRDGFKVLKNLSDEEAKKLFELPESISNKITYSKYLENNFEFFSEHPDNLENLITVMKRAGKQARFASWYKADRGWTIRGISQEDLYTWNWIAVKSSKGDISFNLIGSIVKVDEASGMGDALPDNTSADYISILADDFKIMQPQYVSELSKFLQEIRAGKAKEYFISLLREIAEALEYGETRFFHHDLKKERKRGCWRSANKSEFYTGENPELLICDEAQRLGIAPDETDEIEYVKNCAKVFLCGDDYQMLNKRYDKGLENLRSRVDSCEMISLPESVGVPGEVGELVKYLLCMRDSFTSYSGNFEVEIIHDDDTALVQTFEADNSMKKHYAIPVSSGFYPSDSFVGICKEGKSSNFRQGSACEGKTCDRCTSGIGMINPDPSEPSRLVKQYKYFCSQEVMPNYALSAYELISRELESLYIKVPNDISLQSINSRVGTNWKLNHLYVLMTRPTLRLTLNIENADLYKEINSRLEKWDEAAANLRNGNLYHENSNTEAHTDAIIEPARKKDFTPKYLALEVDDFIEHRSFGVGYVTGVNGSLIDAVFREGKLKKTLVNGRAPIVKI